MREAKIARALDLVVIGAGLTGTGATGFAVENGLRTLQVAPNVGEMHFASGALDLLGIHPVEVQNQWVEPWKGIEALIRDLPQHPYARLGIDTIRNGLKKFLAILPDAGLHYCGWPERNAALPTCAGTLKVTYQVPETAWSGVVGLEEKRNALIIDFEGMKDFSGVQMVKTIGPRWPGLQARRLKFPCFFPRVELDNVSLAEAMESPRVRSFLAESIRPLVSDAEMVGMPAILGIQRPGEVAADLEEQIGVPVFEIPTLPPSVPGLRLKQALDQWAQQRGAILVLGRKAVALNATGRRCMSVVIDNGPTQEIVETRGVILATGRFLGGGLSASRNGIRETVLGLPVYQPSSRKDWHRPRFLDPRGHPVSQAGLEVDDFLRPLAVDGQFAYENLFAAGSVLAHQDWMRMKCGAGLAIATAYGAIQSFMEFGG